MCIRDRTKERIEEAAQRGAATATGDTYHSMALSRGASALGVALALGEVRDAPEEAVCRDWSLYSRVASTSSGVELLRNEIVVLGNATGWSGDLLIDHDVMRDAIDAGASFTSPSASATPRAEAPRDRAIEW